MKVPNHDFKTINLINNFTEPGRRRRGTSILSKIDSKERMDTAAIQATYDLEEQKLQQEEESHRATILAKICTALGNGIWENTNALRRVVYSPEWTASDLRSSLFYSSWIHFTCALSLQLSGYNCPVPIFFSCLSIAFRAFICFSITSTTLCYTILC